MSLVNRRGTGTGPRDGRGVAQLVADFGHHLPPLHPPPVTVKDRRAVPGVGRQARPRRARRRLGAGAGAAGRLSDDLRTGRRGVAADRRRRTALHRRPDGDRLSVRWRLPRRPDRLDPDRDGGDHEPEHDLVRRSRARQVRHRQNVVSADDALWVSQPGPRRRQGRIRTVVSGIGGTTARGRARSAGPHQPAGLRPLGPGLARPIRAPRANAARPWCSPAGCC